MYGCLLEIIRDVVSRLFERERERERVREREGRGESKLITNVFMSVHIRV